MSVFASFQNISLISDLSISKEIQKVNVNDSPSTVNVVTDMVVLQPPEASRLGGLPVLPITPSFAQH